jgi:regulator of protease activity HflC (stomatin/prohibitin superfamily)
MSDRRGSGRSKKGSITLQVLQEQNLLCHEYRKETLEDVYEDKDLVPESSRDDILSVQMRYCVVFLPLYYATHLEMTIDPMHIGLILDEQNNYLLAKPGVHLQSSLFSHFIAQYDLNQQKYINHGDRHIVLIDEGYVGLAWHDGQPVILPDGIHSWTSQTMRFCKQFSLGEPVIKLGPYTLVTVNDGYVGVSQDQGEIKVLEGGQPHILTHAMWKFDYFLPLRVQTDEFVIQNISSADNLFMKVKASVVWRVDDAMLVRTNLTLGKGLQTYTGKQVMERLKQNVFKQAKACVSKFTATVNYTDTFHATAQFASDQQGRRGSDGGQRSGPSMDNPFFDKAKLSRTLGLANAITREYGVVVMAIDVVEASPRDAELRNVLTRGAQAAADALQLARVKRGQAHAAKVKAESKASTLISFAKGEAESRVIMAKGEAEAMVVEAEGSLDAAKKLGSDPLTLLLEKIRISNEVLSGGEKLFMTQHTDKATKSNPTYVFEVDCASKSGGESRGARPPPGCPPRGARPPLGGPPPGRRFF